MISKESTKLW